MNCNQILGTQVFEILSEFGEEARINLIAILKKFHSSSTSVQLLLE